MREKFNIENKKFIVYGLGLTGKSVVNFLKKNNAKKIYVWDDYIVKSSSKLRKKFKFNINDFDYIVISPGINIKKSKFKKYLFKNKRKIITDLDLFFLKNKVLKSVIITGTNGKSTTCSLIHHILKNNKIQNQLAGNIGRPILDIRFTKRDTYIIEASSFQLEYSQFIKPNCAAILNISLDHLDWHGSKKKYINSKIKIFKNQTKKDVAFLNDNTLKKIYKKNKYLGKLRFIKDNPVKPKEINNSYLKLEANKDNLKFAYFIAKYFNINKNNFIKSLKTFNGLSHRHEIFLKHDNVTFINDSKATSFEATKYALKSNDNIIWIVGGQPKKNDKINVNQFKNKIIKAYVIGNHTNFFIKQIYKKINYEVSKDLKTAVKKILRYDKGKKNITVLFSPASASYDQYSNFVERGESFKNLVKDNVKKYI